MASLSQSATTSSSHDHHGAPTGFVKRWLYSTNHKDIGTMYIIFAIVAAFIGGLQQAAIVADEASAPPDRCVKSPFVASLLADEATGNLASGTSETVITTLFEATRTAGAALVLVTHDPALAECCSRVLTIEDGRIVEDRASAHRAA